MYKCRSRARGGFWGGDIGPERGIYTNDKLQQTFAPWTPIDALAFKGPKLPASDPGLPRNSGSDFPILWKLPDMGQLI